MTKFEEDLNKKMDLKEVPMYFTQSGCSITRKTYIETNWIFDNYKNWHSDEEFQELSEKLDDTVDALDIARNSRDEFEREYKKLQSQLQQQALPVVPGVVGIAIKQFKNDQLSLYGALNAILSDVTTEIYAWISKGNQNAFALAFITGKYEVEKPQLFYLKEKNFGYYIANEEMPGIDSPTCMYIENAEKFTQQEIDSMQTGSYEQIEVAES